MNIQDHFRTLVLTLPRAQRKKIDSTIRPLAKHFSVDADELINHTEQGKHWSKRTEEADDVASTKRAVKQKQAFQPVGKKFYSVTYRGQGSRTCTISEVRDITKLTENAIRVRLSKGGGKFHMKIDDTPVTITRTS